MRAGIISPSSLGNTHNTSATVFCVCGDVIKRKYDPNASRRGQIKSPLVCVCGLWCVSCATGCGAGRGQRQHSWYRVTWQPEQDCAQGTEAKPVEHVGISECWRLDRTLLEYPNDGDWTGQC